MSNIAPSPSKTLSSPPIDQPTSPSNANQPSATKPPEELFPKADKQSVSSPMFSSQGTSPYVLSDSSSPGPKLIPPSPSVDVLPAKSEHNSPLRENTAGMSEAKSSAVQPLSSSKGQAETPKNEPTTSQLPAKREVENAKGKDLELVASAKDHVEVVTADATPGPAITTVTRQSIPASPTLSLSPESLTPNEKNVPSLSTSTNSNSNSSSSGNECSDGINSLNEKELSQKSPQPEKRDNKFFTVGVSEDRNKRCRRTMEDAHSFFYDFAGIEGQGFYAIFDGHAGKQTAEWCGHHFHETFQQMLEMHSDIPVQEVFGLTFAEADRQLSQHAGKHSGCTAVTAFIRTESLPAEGEDDVRNGSTDAPKKKYKRVLYTANVGDARVVLCRDGAAKRLSYDHKGSDAREAKRIHDAGGFVMNNRVNGVLAVTRSLGDSSMKDFVVGAPYTTETVVTEKDPFVILACDGLWDVCTDQVAVDLVKDIMDPQIASKKLLDHALENFTTDNLSVMVVRFHND